MHRALAPTLVAALCAGSTLQGCGGGDPTPAPTPAPTPEVYVEILMDGARMVIDPAATGTAVGTKQQFEFTEGPVWVPNEKMWIFSDIPANVQYQFVPSTGAVSEFRNPSNKSNGNFLDKDGTLLTCEHLGRALVKINITTKERTELVTTFGGKKMTSPNDVVVDKEGRIWFTDPDYGLTSSFGHGMPMEQEKNRVYRLDPGALEPVAVQDSLLRPNGLVFGPGETTMYISDSGAAFNGSFNYSLPHEVRVFNVTADGTLTGGEVFAGVMDGLGVPDGMKVDMLGNLWSVSDEGVEIYSPSGMLMAKIHTPAKTANLAFGGADGMDMMLTSAESVWMIRTKVTETPRQSMLAIQI